MLCAVLADPSDETKHPTAAAMTKIQDISVSSVQCIWRGHDLRPHRTFLFNFSNASQFASKLREIIGPCVDPPKHAWHS